MMRDVVTSARLLSALILLHTVPLESHSGPPFPILSNRIAGAYDVSIWSDPDATDDGTAQGKFWVVLGPAAHASQIPTGTRATVSIRALDRKSPVLQGAAAPVDGIVTRQYVALLMDHEGPYGVRVAIDGPLGRVDVDARVDATYDLRPAPALLALFLLPFVLVGALWMKVLRRRRVAKTHLQHSAGAPPAKTP